MSTEGAYSIRYKLTDDAQMTDGQTARHRISSTDYVGSGAKSYICSGYTLHLQFHDVSVRGTTQPRADLIATVLLHWSGVKTILRSRC